MSVCHRGDDRHTRYTGPRHDGDHGTCEPCSRRHCVCCWREHCDNAHPLTCARCVGKLRDDLTAIVTLYDRLPAEATAHSTDTASGATRLDVMGGAAMWMHGPWSTAPGTAPAKEPDIHPLLTLATWEDAWRGWLRHDDGPTATMTGVVGYLDRHLTLMAQQVAPHVDADGAEEWPPEFTEFARDVRAVRAQLEAVLAENLRPVVGVPCFDCRTDLRQDYDDPKPCVHQPDHARRAARGVGPPPPVCDAGCWGCRGRLARHDARVRAAVRAELARHHCDQGGRRDHWVCPGCRRRYTEAEYRRAVAQAHDDTQPLKTASEIRAALGVQSATLRQWVRRGRLARHVDASGRPLYDITEVRRHAMRGGLLEAG